MRTKVDWITKLWPRRRPTATPDPARVAEILAQHETMRALARREMGLPAMSTETLSFTLATADAFGARMADVREWSDRIREATSPFAHVDGTRYFLADDARSGYAIRADGELVNVFSLATGRGDAIVTDAIDNGATHLDCFDGYLPSLYARHGFERVTSLPNWTPGGPDVVYMATRGHLLDALSKAETNTAGILATHGEYN